MVSGVGVEFVGGPLDGQQQVVPCDECMRPERFFVCRTASAWDAPLVRHTYELVVSSRGEGPLWLYRWAGEQR